MPAPVILENGALRVGINPEVGSAIVSVVHRPTGLSVLGSVPWDAVTAADSSLAAPDERAWLTRYTGGWPLLFPNGGDACTFDGAFHGFHGEASIAPWRVVEQSAIAVRVSRRFVSVPVEMERDIVLEGDVVIVRETARVTGSTPVRVMWGHHPTFGSDLLAADFVIETGARTVAVDAGYDPPANPLLPGAAGTWPTVAGKAGPVDLSRPRSPCAAMGYLRDFSGGAWAGIRRLDGAIAAVVSWDAAMFPCAWLWIELEGTTEAPWLGRTRLIGLEPNTSWPGAGLANVERAGGPLLTLTPGSETATAVRLHVFRPRGPVAGVGSDGRALIA